MNMPDAFNALVRVIIRDSKYNSLTDRYDQMDYLVAVYGAQLAHYGDSYLRKCAQYEAASGSRKRTPLAQLYQHKVDRLLESSGQVLNEEQYAKLMDLSNKALVNVELNWSEWSSGSVDMMKLYVRRAVISYDRQHYRRALSDMRHVCSLLAMATYPNQITDYFEHQDKDVLTSAVRLTAQLLEHMSVESSDFEAHKHIFERLGRLDFEARKNVAKALQAIIKMGEIIETFVEDYQVQQDNYQLNSKARLCESEDSGRFYVAGDHIRKGEVVLLERSQFVVTFSEHLHSYCDYCHRSLDTLWPCVGCTEVVYCSARCGQLAHSEYHSHECGIFGFLLQGKSNFYTIPHLHRWYATFGLKLATFCEDLQMFATHQHKPEHEFDVGDYLGSDELRQKSSFQDLSEQERFLLCRGLTSLVSHRGQREQVREACTSIVAVTVVYGMIYKGLLRKEVVADPVVYPRLLEHVSTCMVRITTNGFSWGYGLYEADSTPTWFKVASCVAFVGSFFNHSCDANVEWHVAEGGIISMVALRSIEPDEPLTICYGPRQFTPFLERQQRLRSDYCFYCCCEVCLKDAANGEDTLACLHSDCEGPLVPNQFGACLTCGHSPSSLPQAFLNPLVRSLRTASSDFMRTFKKMHRADGLMDKLVKAFLKKKTAPETKKTSMYKLTSEGDHLTTYEKSHFTFVKPLNHSKLTMSRITKLEHRFAQYAKLIYSGSHHLLEKCALLLKVYLEAGLEVRGLQLIDHVSHCLKSIYPSLTDQSLVKLIYLLNYLVHFYDHLHQSELSFTEESNNSITSFKFKDFYVALNTKLFEVLQYDLENRGHFFSVLYAAIQHSAKSPISLGGEEVNKDRFEFDSSLNATEQFYRDIYLDCQSRLQVIKKDFQDE